MRAIFILVLSLFLLLPIVITTANYEDTELVDISFVFSKPFIKNGFLSLREANSYLLMPSLPRIPIFVKPLEFPWGTKIVDIQYSITPPVNHKLDSPLVKTPLFHSINGDKTLGSNYTKSVYPEEWLTYNLGVGLNKTGVHTLFLTLRIQPIRYNLERNYIEYIQGINIRILYKYSPTILLNNSSYDLLIITPRSYLSTLNPLIKHKELHGVRTIVGVLDDIYREYDGRDEAEKIKYFIKNMVEEDGVKYVLLIGDITQLPIRQADAYPWSGYHGFGILTDLYYADLYNSRYEFCSWDENNNNLFGEVNYNRVFPPRADSDLDKVDLYPDVFIGRIPCSSSSELSNIINKIITYEDVTYNQIWFQKIILVGGDTFPPAKLSPPFVYEGEITNMKVAQQLPGFEKIYLWASKHNLNVLTFNHAVSEGAGFLSYAGHGFEHGWGTYRPNAILNHNLIFYYTPYLKFLHNRYRLPVVFMDACLTAKLDFNISDLRDYFKWKTPILNLFLHAKPGDILPCFAWCFLKQERGGAIAIIGATRPAYTYVDRYGVYAGAGYLDVHFFKSYHEGVTVGEMLMSAQTDYLNYVFKDYFTIEEFILLGDPSLRVGGYP